jgi:GNAT superfamily N-acetyltransferase
MPLGVDDMIRQRREEDLDRLCAILECMTKLSIFPGNIDLREWLTERDAERSWVFDMAPIQVAPTKNVVAHVQIYPLAPRLVATTPADAGGVLAVGRLFVRPGTHEHGIGRYLLKQSVDFIQNLTKLPVLDLAACFSMEHDFYAGLGFEELPSRDPEVALMVYTR